MITIEEKLYITKEVNQIVVKYAEKIVLDDLLKTYSFVDKNDFIHLTQLIMDVYNFCPEKPNKLTSARLTEFCIQFLDQLSKEDLVAVHFWTINHYYFKYLEREESIAHHELEESLKNSSFEEKFGRELAQKIYDPEATELKEDCITLLVDYLFSFTDQLDLSLIDADTAPAIIERIEMGIWA